MSDPVNQLLSNFQLAQLPVLPEILLQSGSFASDGLPAIPGNKLSCNLGSIISSDPALMLKLLASDKLSSVESSTITGVESLLDELGDAGFSLLWSQAAHISSTIVTDSEFHYFLKLHWAQSVSCSLIMRKLARKLGYPRIYEAGICGLLMGAGQLVMASVFTDDYLGILRDAESYSACLHEERLNFEVDQCEVGAELLRRLGLPKRLCDAVHYQSEEASHIADTGMLVRLAWLSRQLCQGADFSALSKVAKSHLGLDEGVLQETVSYALRGLNALSEAWQLGKIEPTFPPLTVRHGREGGEGNNGQAGKTLQATSFANSQLQLLEAASFSSQPSRSKLEMVNFTQRGLQLLFGVKTFFLYQYDQECGELCPAGGSVPLVEFEEFTVSCKPQLANRNMLLRCFLSGEAVTSRNDNCELVLDHQIHSALASLSITVLPISLSGSMKGVLLIGHDDKLFRKVQMQPEMLATFLRRLAKGLEFLDGKPLGNELGDTDQSLSPSMQASLQNSLDSSAATLSTTEQTAAESSMANQVGEQQINAIVHEAKNPLAIIKNYLQLLSMKQSGDVKEELDVIRSEIDRVNDILGQLKPGADIENLQQVALNDIVRKICRVIQASLPEESGLSLELLLDNSLPMVHSSESRLRQIITNLVKNSVEALNGMNRSGKITVSTSLRLEMDGRRFQQLTVSDNGPGLDNDIIDKLFSFGNTSKGETHSGAGLAVIKTLTEELGGVVSCQSGSEGTRFTVLLPVMELAEANE